MEQANALEGLIGRESELRRLHSAFKKRKSQLIWGAPHSGKTFLFAKMLSELPQSERRKCICWTGPVTRRQLVEHLIQGLYLAGDPLVKKKVSADRQNETTLSRWISDQSALRLRGILITAAEQGDYRFFLDHLPPVSHTLAQLLKEIMYRAKTPVYLSGQGYSQAEIGDAWSLYWTDEYRIRLGPISEASGRKLVEACIQKFGLGSLDLTDFRDALLHLSGHLPGSIVKMCELAANPRYHYGDQVKLKLLHVDYLLSGGRIPSFEGCAT